MNNLHNPILFCALWLLFPVLMHGQSLPAQGTSHLSDSLHTALAQALHPADSAWLYLRLAYDVHGQNDIGDSLYYYSQLARACVRNPTSYQEEEAYIVSCFAEARFHHQTDNLSAAYKALRLAEDIILGSAEKALHTSHWVDTHRQMAEIHYKQRDIASAISSLHEVFPYLERYAQPEYKVTSKVYFDLSMYHQATGEVDTAEALFDRGMQQARITGENDVIIKKKRMKAGFLMEEGKLQEAEQVLLGLLPELERLQNPRFSMNVYNKLYMLSDSLGNMQAKLKYIQLAWEAATQTNIPYYEAVQGIYYADALHDSGESGRAYPLLRKYQKVLRKQLEKETKESIEKAEIEQKEQLLSLERREYDLKAAALQERNTMLWVIGTLAFLAFVLAGFYYASVRRKAILNRQLQEQKEELEALDQLKSHFFANISHELRTPLTLISSPLQKIMHAHQEEMSPAILQQLRYMERNSRQLHRLVEDILDLTKLDAQKLQVYTQPTTLSTFSQRLVANYASMATHLRIDLQATIADSLQKSAFWIDTEKTERVINNLLSNALKHCSSGARVTLTLYREADKIHFEVADNGKGIPPTDLPYIFDRFYQGEQQAGAFQGGTGLGLALSKELAEAMGGHLHVHSQLGEGSTFLLSLPAREASTEEVIANVKEQDSMSIYNATQAISQVSNKEKEGHILIAEDHPDMQEYIASLLNESYHIHRAANGREALNILKKEPVDLVISDVMMPEVDGYALLQEIKGNSKLRTIPVIMLTALSDENHRLEALQIGVDDYLAKPFSPQELYARIHNLLINALTRKQSVHEEFAEMGVLQNVQHGSLPAEPENEKREHWIEKVTEVLLKELENEDFQLSDLAQRFHLSERQLRRKIKALTGLTPKQLQQEVALQKARKLLETRQYDNPTAVALSVGINHVTRFNKLYTDRFGKHPKEYFD